MDEKMIDEIVTETIDNGTIENVHIAPIGKFYGSDAEGNPVPEDITKESLEALAQKLNEKDAEVLCDVDHGASKQGLDRNTHAAGWFTRFVVDPIKGLFAKLKLTRHGKDLLENREYRFISPTFSLDENGQPVDLYTASITNTPAFEGYINPILNQEAKPISEDKGIINMDMTKDDLIALIKDTVKNMEAAEEKAEEVKETVEEVKEEKVEETVDNGCSDTEEKVENACSEVKNEEVVEEVKEEKIEEAKEEPVEEKEEKEVIKMEALNSKPVALADINNKSWMNLHGKEFWDYLAKHPEIKG